MMAMTRVFLFGLAIALAGASVRAQSSAAVSTVRGAAQAGIATARGGRSAQSPTAARAAEGTKPPAAGATQGTSTTQGGPDVPPAPAGFTYNSEGRRDPFVSLATRGNDPRSASVGQRPVGLAGLDVAAVTLRGTLRSRDGFVAMLEGADQKTYIVRPGDKLFDGVVSSISQSDLVILQQVNDPLSLDKQREVRKGLRQAEAN